MASAIEYGLIAGLIGVAAVAAMGGLSGTVKKTDQKHVVYDKPVLHTIGQPNLEDLGEVVQDTQTGCHYLLTRTGITIRYTKQGIIDCPETVSVSLSQFNTASNRPNHAQ